MHCETSVLIAILYGSLLLFAAFAAILLAKSGRRRRSRRRVIAGSAILGYTAYLAFQLVWDLSHPHIPNLSDVFRTVPANITELTVDHHENCDSQHLYFRFHISSADYSHLRNSARTKPGMVPMEEFPGTGELRFAPAWWSPPPRDSGESLHMQSTDDETSTTVDWVTLAMWYDHATGTAFVHQSRLR
jgi:hypothetical protein